MFKVNTKLHSINIRGIKTQMCENSDTSSKGIWSQSSFLQVFPHCRIIINWTIVTIAPALHVVNFLYAAWPSS